MGPSEADAGAAASPVDALSATPSRAGLVATAPTEAPKRAGGAAARAKLAASAAHLPTPKKSLGETLNGLWARRQQVAMQPHPGAALKVLRSSEPERPTQVEPDRYLKGLLEVSLARPPGSRSSSSSSKDAAALRKRMRGVMRGEQSWGALARDQFCFHRGGDAPAPRKQIFIHANPEHVPAVAAKLVRQVLDRPGRFPGVSRCLVAGPFMSGRANNLVLDLEDEAAVERVVDYLATLRTKAPGWFESSVLLLSEPRLPGVSVGDAPDPERYPGETFSSVRSQILHAVVCIAAERDMERPAFDAMVKARWAEAGLDFDQPHLHLAGAAWSNAAVTPIPGALPVEAGALTVHTPSLHGSGSVPVEVVISEEAAAALNKRKDVRFLPQKGLFAKVDVDRTRDPPRERVVKQYAACYVDDTRFRLDFGRQPPPFVHYDPASKTYHIPERVLLAPKAPGTYSNYQIEVELDPERPGLQTPPPLVLSQRIARPHYTGEKLAATMQEIDGYLTDPAATLAQRVVLEEGMNGVSVVRLTNGGVAVWKPSAAEYPEQCRVQLEADHQARREAFAYWLSKNLGHLGRVPPTVYRDFDGESGVLSALSRGTLPGTHSPELELILQDPAHPIYQEMAVLDCVTGNLDRHRGNILLGHGAALAIDHGLAFPLAHGDQGPHNTLFSEDVELSPDQKHAIGALLTREHELREKAAELDIATAAVDRLIERLETMHALGRTYADWRTAPDD